MLRLAAAIALFVPAVGQARDEPRAFGRWAVFRDARTGRCRAMTLALGGQGAATLTFTLAPGLRPQLHLQLRRPVSRAELRLEERRFPLLVRGAEAWAADARTDAAIVAGVRREGRLEVRANDAHGGHFRDSFTLAGAASAIDAAAVACLTS